MYFYVDGGVLGGSNPGTSIYWSVAEDWPDVQQSAILVRRQVSTEYTTNNEAEYKAVIAALDIVLGRLSDVECKCSGFCVCNWKSTDVVIHSDSKLIVEHINGNWQCNEARLRPLLYVARDKIRRCREQGVSVVLVQVPRKENVRRLGH